MYNFSGYAVIILLEMLQEEVLYSPNWQQQQWSIKDISIYNGTESV